MIRHHFHHLQAGNFSSRHERPTEKKRKNASASKQFRFIGLHFNRPIPFFFKIIERYRSNFFLFFSFGLRFLVPKPPDSLFRRFDLPRSLNFGRRNLLLLSVFVCVCGLLFGRKKKIITAVLRCLCVCEWVSLLHFFFPLKSYGS